MAGCGLTEPEQPAGPREIAFPHERVEDDQKIEINCAPCAIWQFCRDGWQPIAGRQAVSATG